MIKRLFSSKYLIGFFLTAFFLSFNCHAENISLDFDKDILESPPQGVFSSGISSPGSYVRVERDSLRGSDDLSVIFKWSGDGKAPKMVVASDKTPFPSQGSLLFDFIVKKHGGPFHIVGKSDKGRTLFHFLVNKAGQGAVRTGNGDTIINDFIIGQWYLQRLSYNFEKGVYSIILDNYFSSGEVKSSKLEKGESFKEIVFYGEKGGPSLYGLDSIFLVATKPNPSRTRRTDLPFGALKRKIHWDTFLVPENKYKRAIIVYPSGMKGGAELAIKLRDFIKEKTDQSISCLSDRVVTDSDTWLVREKYLETPMIALGNAVDNRVLYAVATKFLAMSNHRWPGKDRFCNRSILEPFRRDVNLILLEASTAEGLKAAVDSFSDRLRALKNKNLSVPYFRKLGAAKGKWQEKQFKKKGLDLSKSIEDIKKQLIKKHGKSARIRGGSLYFYQIWQWLSGSSIEAAKYAAAVLLFQQDKMPDGCLFNNHYNFDRTFKAWQLCFTSGVVDEKLINRIESVMAKSAADPRDYHAYGLRYHSGKRIAGKGNRHSYSSLSNYICCPDYVLTHCRMNSITRKVVESYDKAYRRVTKRFTDSFRDSNDTSSIPDSMVTMVNLMALTGNLDFVRNGTLRNAVSGVVSLFNNLGYYTAQSPYIGNSLTSSLPGRSVLGAAAFYYRDPEYQWLYKHLKLVACRCSHDNPVFDDAMPEKYPKKYIGVTALPFDKRIYRANETPDYLPSRELKCDPSGIPYEKLYDSAVFRDGFEPDKAFLFLMSTQLINNHALNHSNAIIQYTDLGKVLLYTSSCLVEKWARNVVTASNGMPSKATFACVKKAMINSGDISAISSVNPHSGNSEWTRNIVHHKGHFFVVIDQMKALEEDEYAFTSRWRTYYQQTLEEDGACLVDAGDGVKMRIIGAGKDFEHESYRAKADGSTRPYMYIQRKSKRLKNGESASFKNVFYASSEKRPDNCEVREVDKNSLIVKATGKGWSETALIGVNKTSNLLKNLKIEADVFYVNKEKIVAANCRKIELAGKVLFKSVDGENTTIRLTGEDLALNILFAKLAKPKGVTAKKIENHGLKELWSFDDFNFPNVKLKIKSVSSNVKALRNPTERLNDDIVPVRVFKKHQAVYWGNTAERPLEIVLDMGNVVDIKEIRLPSVVEDGYYRKFYYQPGEMKFKVIYSNDNFKDDIQETNPKVFEDIYSYPRAQYTYAGRVPVFVIPVDRKTRYVKIIPETTKEFIAFQKIIVYGKEKNKKLICKLKSADLDGGGSKELLVLTSNSELLVLSAKGDKLWSEKFSGSVTAWNIVDLENDGKKEILVYTTEDKLFALKHDGGELLRSDLNEFSKTIEPDKWDRWYCTYCFKHVDAWDPDGDGIKEIVGFGHTTRATIQKDGSIEVKTVSGAYQPEATLVDSSVAGRKILAGMSSSISFMDTNYKTFQTLGLPAKSSGNNLMPGLARIFAINDSGLKGFLAVNPVSIMYVSGNKLKKKWSEFSKVPITCCELWDFNGDGRRELISGYKDGFIRIYNIEDGEVVKKVLTGPYPVKGFEILGEGGIAVISSKALMVFNRKLENIASHRIKADDIAIIGSGDESEIAISDELGNIHVFKANSGE